MAGRRQEQQPFNPPGVVLFRLRFNVYTANSADFNRFIGQVEQQLSECIQPQRHYGMHTMELPPVPVRQNERGWIVIELATQECSVPCFIEAETIYLRGYQNQEGELFEFARQAMGDNLPPPPPYLGSTSTSLSFSCNYIDLVGSTKGGSDPGLTLQPLPEPETKKDEVPRPNFGKRRLQDAVSELAQGRNRPGQSQHRTAQNLLLVIIRFCESIRFRSIRREMVDLWEVERSTGQPSRCLSSNCFWQIKNWNNVGSHLQRSFRDPTIAWPKILENKTGIGSPTDAKDILAVVMFCEYQYQDEPSNPVPQWRPPDNNRSDGGPGPGGAAGGVHAAELPGWFPMPEDPVMHILGIYVQRGASRLEGVYGTVTVTDGLGAQVIYGHTRDNCQRNAGDSSQMRLELNIMDRFVSAYDCWDIDIDLWSASTGAQVSTGRISWSICNFSSNKYDDVMRRTIGQAVVEYVVCSRATSLGTDDGVTYEIVPTSPMAPQDPSAYRYETDNPSSDPTTESSGGGYMHDEL